MNTKQLIQKEVKDILIQPNYFVDWLNEYELTDIVGQSRDSCKCPITKFLKAKILGQRQVSTSLDNICFYSVFPPDKSEENEMYPHYCQLPLWVSIFIRFLDSTYCGEEVTTADCLEILGQIELKADDD